MTTSYIDSSIPGQSFSVSVYKPDGRPAYATATEGVVEKSDKGWTSFTTELFGDKYRSARVMLKGTNSAKNREAALRELVSNMEAAGWIPEGQIDKVSFDK